MNTLENLIEAAHQSVIKAESRDKRLAYWSEMIRLINERDPAEVQRLESERMKRCGL